MNEVNGMPIAYKILKFFARTLHITHREQPSKENKEVQKMRPQCKLKITIHSTPLHALLPPTTTLLMIRTTIYTLSLYLSPLYFILLFPFVFHPTICTVLPFSLLFLIAIDPCSPVAVAVQLLHTKTLQTVDTISYAQRKGAKLVFRF